MSAVPQSTKPFALNVEFIIGEGNDLQAVLDDLMTKVNARVKETGGYAPQALFPVAVLDSGGYLAYQQWKWYTDIPETE